VGLAVDDVAVDDVGGRGGPHPSVEGRGTGWLGLHGWERSGAARWWWQEEGKMNQHQPSMRLMLHSNSAPTPKKALDLSAYEHD
jgi:hypothetical protein